MARRQIIEDPVSHDRWLVSYADFITLLFAFFVVMYSISQVNEGKYKVLADTFTEAFNVNELVIDAELDVEQDETMRPGLESNPEKRIDPFQIGELARSNPRKSVAMKSDAIIQRNGDSNVEQLKDELGDDLGMLAAEFQNIDKQIEGAFGDLLDNELLTVRGNEEWLEVELKSSVLFGSGNAQLSTPALELLAEMAELMKSNSNPVRVEGFTDNQPIGTQVFPSNWELSTARAAAVVQLFVEEGIDPSRLAAVGYGEFQPIADNSTAQGREANRRVVLMISKTGELRPSLREVAKAEDLVDEVIETGIRINIPGVTPELDQEQPAESEPELEPEPNEEDLQGVRTIELDGGGLLFTSDPIPSGDQ